jgi:hypothetical protein
MSRNKLTLEFPGLEEYAEKLDRLAGSGVLKKAVGEALEQSKNLVNEQLHEQMKQHRRTGHTEASIMDSAKVEWSGNEASVEVGFDIAHGGLPSIFLMYGTPKQAKDQKLYNAIYGAATKRKIKQLQEEAFQKAIDEVMGG